MSTTPKSPAKKNVMVCFCAKDKDQDGKDALVAHLTTVNAALTWWSIDEVAGGRTVREEFQQVAAAADAALLLLSADFFATLHTSGAADWSALPLAEQVELLRQQQQRGLELIPVVWRECEWRQNQWHDSEWLAALQPLPVDGTAIRGLDPKEWDRELAKIAARLSGKVTPAVANHGVTLRIALLLIVPMVVLGALGLGQLMRRNAQPPVGSAAADAAVTVAVKDQAVAPTVWRLEGLIRAPDNEPLAGVTVSLPERDVTTQTNQHGHFAFTVAAEQSELVLLRADLRPPPGGKRKYQPQELHVNLGSTKLDIVLAASH